MKKYTWGEIQIISIQKMFLNNNVVEESKLEEYRKEKNYRIYLNNMPHAANEGILLMLTRGKPYVKEHTLLEDPTYSEGNYKVYDLKSIIKDYYKLHSVMINGKKYNTNSPTFNIRNNRYLVLPDNISGWVNIFYESKPEPITTNTKDDELIDLPYELATILPLYIASELYKDDDISLSTIYRNQFETELDYMSDDDNDLEFVDVKGIL